MSEGVNSSLSAAHNVVLGANGTMQVASRTRPATTTVLVTQRTSLATNAVYRIVYTNLLYFIVMFLIPLVVLLILNGELIRVLRDKKAKRAQLLRGRSRLASVSAAATGGQHHVAGVDSGRYSDVNTVICHARRQGNACPLATVSSLSRNCG